MHTLFDQVPVIANLVASHGEVDRDRFVRACLSGHWSCVSEMVEAVLAQPEGLHACQCEKLREFLEFLPFSGRGEFN